MPLTDSNGYVLKVPFVEGEIPDPDYKPDVLAKELASIGWYMPDNKRDNVRIVNGLVIPIDFDIIEELVVRKPPPLSDR